MATGEFSRRTFVKSAAAVVPVVAAGLALPGVAHGGYFRSGRASLKVGLIGCGGRGTGAAIQALRADPGVELIAMSDVFRDRVESSLGHIREELAEELGDQLSSRVRVTPETMHVGFDSYRQVIASDVDVVLLTSYPHFRPLHYRAAIEAGKHVFAEKPVAVDAPGIRSVLETARLAREKKLATVVGFCWRYNDGMRAAFDRIHEGAAGDVVSVHTTYHTTTLSKRPRKPEWSDMEFQLRNWWHFNWLSGDHIVEQAIHSVDRMAWAMKDKLPARVTCLGGRAARVGPEHGDVYDHFAAIYEYDDGRRAFHTCRQIDSTPADNSDYVYGTRGACTVNGWAPTYVVKDPTGKEIWKYPGPVKRDMYQAEHDELFASIRAGNPINDCERGANSTMMAIMARMAAYTGQVVTWDQAMKSREDLTPPSYDMGPRPEITIPVPGKTPLL